MRHILLTAVLMHVSGNAATREDRKDPVWIIGTGPAIVAAYPRKMNFIQLPAGVSVGKDESGRSALLRGSKRTEPDDLAPAKTMTFKHAIRLIPTDDGERLLVCSNLLSLNVGPGEIDDFCGIVSKIGEVIYRFPVKQRRPDKLIAPIGISADGAYAEIVLGTEVEGEDRPHIGAPYEVLAWSYPKGLKKFPAPKDSASAWNEIRTKFRERLKK